jgi:hypothetical protein
LTGLFYSDALSLNKPFFLNHYGFDPELTKYYKVHFDNAKLKHGGWPVYNRIDNNVPYLLEKYDRSLF